MAYYTGERQLDMEFHFVQILIMAFNPLRDFGGSEFVYLGQFHYHKMKGLDRIWVSECVSFYRS